MLKCSARITDGRGKNALLVQPQRVLGICLGAELSAAPKEVQQLGRGDGVTECSSHGPEERMAQFDTQGISKRRHPQAGEAGHRAHANP